MTGWVSTTSRIAGCFRSVSGSFLWRCRRSWRPGIANAISARPASVPHVGDACQPLHGSGTRIATPTSRSRLRHHREDTGDPDTEDSHVGAGVQAGNSKPRCRSVLAGYRHRHAGHCHHDRRCGALHRPGGGDGGGEVDRRAAGTIAPKTWRMRTSRRVASPSSRPEDLMGRLRPQTIQVMTDGAETLARVWAGAWQGHRFRRRS